MKVADGRSRGVMSTAAFSAPLDTVRLLLNHGSSINFSDEMGRWPIQLATKNSLDVFKACVEAGGDITLRDKLDGTVLHFAAIYGNLEVVKYLLGIMRPGAVNNIDMDGWTPLCWAVKVDTQYSGNSQMVADRFNVVKLLIEQKADRFCLAMIRKDKYSVLKIAKYGSLSVEIINMLKKGARGLSGGIYSTNDIESRLDNSYKNVKPGATKELICSHCDFVSFPSSLSRSRARLLVIALRRLSINITNSVDMRFRLCLQNLHPRGHL